MHRKDGNMEQAVFNEFVKAVRNADANDPVFYAGYLWTSLTDKQCDATKEALFSRLVRKGDCRVWRNWGGSLTIECPTGIGLLLNDSDVGRYATEIAAALEKNRLSSVYVEMKGGNN